MTGQAFWFISRATGVVSVVLLTVVVCLGVLTAGRRRPHGARATVVMGMHRWLSLGMLAFLATHIVTAIVDGYVTIGWAAVVVPLASEYQTLWVGLGTLAVDLLVAVMVTSLLRHRIREQHWRTVHWLSYAMWLVAVVHGFAMGTADEPALRLVSLACGIIGGLFISWRLFATHADRERRAEVDAQEWS